MKEFLGGIPKQIGKLRKGIMREHLAQNVVDAFSSGDLKNVKDFALKHIEQLGVQPIFIKENDPNLKEMRRRLNTESGIIICNHPGWSDTAMILSIIDREDIKIMMSKDFFDLLPPAVANKYFFPSEKDPARAVAIFNKINEHIKNGGVLLIYPTGGNERKNGTGFKDGFRVLLRGLKPEQMVYCFNINSSDVRESQPRLKSVGVASELFLHPSVNINRVAEKSGIRMDETYTQASEWQEAAKNASKSEVNKVLTKKYEDMFLTNQ